MPQLAKPRVLLDGLAIGESPRWHDRRLWLCNWGAAEIVAVGLDGSSEVMARGPDLLGWSIGWLPNGRMLITGEELVRVEPDGSRVQHADLGHISPYGWNEITVDGSGNVYVNTINFDFAEFNHVLTTGKAPGRIALVTPDGEAREVASEIAFPNGMVVTPDNTTLIVAESFALRLTAFDIASDGSLLNRRTWAEPVGPDGICLDADGCIWASSGAMTNDCARIREGGEVLERIDLDRSCFATMLGGPDRRTLFMLVADWRGPERSTTRSRREPDRCSSWTLLHLGLAGRKAEMRAQPPTTCSPSRPSSASADTSDGNKGKPRRGWRSVLAHGAR
jgi:sugar lactone lactonase YvrE